jgi:gamma-glutamylcyclotransferase (GGCT)/AIG2-like uncharacterized protein YtfP
MHWVFANGSNMHLGDLRRWLTTSDLPPGRILQAEAAKLVGYRLVWNYYSPARAGGAANVEPADEELPGVALRLDAEAFQALDRKEGYPERYGRTQARAFLARGEAIEAWVYVAQARHVEPDPIPPSRRYRELLLEGAAAFGLPEAHLAALRALATCD